MAAITVFKSIFRKQLALGAMVFTSVMLIISACNLPGNQAAEPEEPVDPNAQLYRMYYDSSADATENELQIRKFIGQIRMADIESLFGSVDELPQDEYGNFVCGPVLGDGLLWSLMISPSQVGVNLTTRDLDEGTLSSALDLDGDGIADIVDNQLGDGRRLTLVTEDLGMGVFEQWLKNIDPLCDDDSELADFWCGDTGDRASGSGVESLPNRGIIAPGGFDVVPFDPFADICADYNTTGPRSPVRAQGRVPGSLRGGNQSTEVHSTGSTSTVTAIYEDANGQWTGTTKTIREYDLRDNLTRTVIETVHSDGSGERTIVVHSSGSYDPETDTATLPGLDKTKHQTFQAHTDENGDYDGSESEPPTPGKKTDSTKKVGDRGDPLVGLAEYCEARGNFVSGVERAAATDPTAFKLGCGDLVDAPSGGDDCTIFEWGRAVDFEGATEPGDDDCGPFEEPDPETGKCGPANAIEKLKGRTALIASINFEFEDICPDIICDDNSVESEAGAEGIEARQEISSTDMAPFQCIAPISISEISSDGEVTELTLCNKGPGPGYKTVSSLKAGNLVEILGLGAEAGWLVVDNPIYPGEACWVPEDDIEVDPQLDFGGLPVFAIPDLSGNGSEGSVCTLNDGICGNGGMQFNSANCSCE